MMKIQVLQNEWNSHLSICPDVSVTKLLSSIQRKFHINPEQIKHKYVNDQSVDVTEQVIS
jgi:hypothetical protein